MIEHKSTKTRAKYSGAIGLAGNVHGILCSRLAETRVGMRTRIAGSRQRSVVAAAGNPPIPSQPSSQPHINLALIHFGKEPRAALRPARDPLDLCIAK